MLGRNHSKGHLPENEDNGRFAPAQQAPWRLVAERSDAVYPALLDRGNREPRGPWLDLFTDYANVSPLVAQIPPDTTMRRLILTVDVEALPARQSTQHVERLIWGRFGAEEAGIDRMMDIAERHGAGLTFFVDFCERFLHPGAIEVAGKRIVERGHDLQLHAHPEFMSADFWAKFGLPEWKTSLSGYTPERAKALMDFLVDSARECGGNPVAFRGGAFRFNHHILREMAAHGLPLSFNYNVKSTHQPNNELNRSVFAWNNGVIEVPTGHVEHRGFLRSFNSNLMDLGDRDSVHEYLDTYFQRFGEDAALVLVMHSWSFCERNQTTGHFELKDDRLQLAFDGFLRDLPQGYAIVTATQLALELAEAAAKPSEVRDIELVDRDRYPPRDAVAPAPVAPPVAPDKVGPWSSTNCNFCGTPESSMQDLAGRRRVRCPGCKSLQENRVFLWVYERFVQPEFDVVGKRLLLVAPTDGEAGYFRARAEVTSCDVRRSASVDRQLDLARMPEVADGSFDAVVALGVLQSCADDEAVLDEARRVLKPGGRLFLQVPLRSNANTEGVQGSPARSPEEAADELRTGAVRRYGDLSLLRSLQRRFLVKTFAGYDPVTLGTGMIFCGIKDPGS